MDGILIKDDLFKGGGVCHRVESQGSARCDNNEEKCTSKNVDDRTKPTENNGMRVKQEFCGQILAQDNGLCSVKIRRETGSRRKGFFRFYSHFRSFEKTLVFLSFIMLIHGIG